MKVQYNHTKFSVQMVADALEIHRQTVYSDIRKGKLATTLIGSHYFIEVEEFKRYRKWRLECQRRRTKI